MPLCTTKKRKNTPFLALSANRKAVSRTRRQPLTGGASKPAGRHSVPWEGRAGGEKCCHLPMMDENEPATPLHAFCQQDQAAWFTCQARDVRKALADLSAALVLLPVSLFGTLSSSDGSLPPPHLPALRCVMHPHSLPLSPTPQATSLLTGVAQVTASACPRRHGRAASGRRHHLPVSQWPPSRAARVTASPSSRGGRCGRPGIRLVRRSRDGSQTSSTWCPSRRCSGPAAFCPAPGHHRCQRTPSMGTEAAVWYV